MSTKSDVVEYISQTQPLLEKMAEEKQDFECSLQLKLASLVKAGSLSNDEAEVIKVAVMKNPAAVFNFLDAPVYNQTVGTVKSASYTSFGSNDREVDPLEEFVNSF